MNRSTAKNQAASQRDEAGVADATLRSDAEAPVPRPIGELAELLAGALARRWLDQRRSSGPAHDLQTDGERLK